MSTLPIPSFPTIYQLKPLFQQVLQPLAHGCIRHHISPNALTLSALGLSVVYGALFAGVYATPWFGLYCGFLPLVLFLRMALNALDGMVARQTQQMSHTGAILNELGDVLSDIVLYGPWILMLDGHGWTSLLWLGVIVVSILTEVSGILNQALTGTRTYHGPWGKSDRALAFGLLALGVVAAELWISPLQEGMLILFAAMGMVAGLMTCYRRLAASSPKHRL